MADNRQYRRALTNWERDTIVKLYGLHANSRGLLTKKMRQRLMGLRKKEPETSESDFWYNIKRYAKGALLDLELISYVASDEQLKEIYKPYAYIDNLKIDLLFGSRKKEELPKEQADIKGVYSRTDMSRFLSQILRSHKSEPIVNWKEKLAG